MSLPRLLDLHRRATGHQHSGRRVNGTRKLTSCRQGGFYRRSQHFLDLGVVLSSSRRVKKGPGRRPQSAKRQRFMELRERGWSILAAAREVGVSRTTGNNWSRGYKIYRRGQVVGFVPPLERLAVRQISPRFLSQDERIEIADLRHAGLSIRQIAQRLGRAPSTISRELRRNATSGRWLPPVRRAPARDRASRPPSPATRRDQRASCGSWSPSCWRSGGARSRSAATCADSFPEQPGMWLCHESIYQAVYQPGSALLRPSRLAPHRRSPLRTGRDHRRAHQRTERRRPRFEQPMLTIHQRPFPPEDRSEAGHWEGDLIIGKDQGSAIGTLVERQTRMVRLLHLPQPRRRRPARRADGADGRPAAGAAAVDHLGPGHRDGPPPHDHRSRSARRSTSATPARPGSAARTRTPTGCCATTSPRAPT